MSAVEFNKPMDVSAFDWDDTALIKAYDRVMEAAKKSKCKQSKGAKENVKEVKLWEIGDYCRAPYYEDGSFYEAVIVDVQGDSCTVEFLGYGDYEEAMLDALEDSLGKKARQKQRKSVKKPQHNIYTSDTDFSCMTDNKDVSKASKSMYRPNANVTAEQCEHYEAQHHPQVNFPHSAPPQFPFNPIAHAPPAPQVQRMVGPTSCMPPPPPPPPMPPCSAVSNDPSLSAMLMSWYMAGYYTGLHQNQKSSHCPKSHCCDHPVVNHCGHH